MASNISTSVQPAQTGNLLVSVYQNIRLQGAIDSQFARVVLDTFSSDENPLNRDLIDLVRTHAGTDASADLIKALCEKYLIDPTMLDSLQGLVLPDVLSKSQLELIKNWYREIIEGNKNYQDFDNRIGISWTDYRTKRDAGGLSFLSNDPVKKTVGGKEQFPEPFFNHPEISKVLLKTLLPQFMSAVSDFQEIPETIYWQTFFLRSDLSQIKPGEKHVSWHRDPSEYEAFADYTMVVMLDNPQDAEIGWEGGELLVKKGEPKDRGRCLRLTPKQNQAILFNNKLNSHAVTQVQPKPDAKTRDIIVINMYLTDPSLKL